MRDLTDPDDLPGLADVAPDDLEALRRRRQVAAPSIVGRLLAGEAILVDPAVTPADLIAGRVTEITFPIQRPQEPTMHVDHPDRRATAAADPAMVPDDPHDAGNVTVATRRITNELDGLDRLIEALADRLGDGLRDAEPTDVRPPSPTPGGMAPLACRLHTVADRLDDVNGRLARILDRIDL